MTSIRWTDRYWLDLLPDDVPNGPGVYKIESDKPFGRLKGDSTIVYIGESKDLGVTLAGRRRDNPSPAEKLLSAQGHRLQVSYAETGTKSEALTTEQRLLQEYEREHWELPPGNERYNKEWRKWVDDLWDNWRQSSRGAR